MFRRNIKKILSIFILSALVLGTFGKSGVKVYAETGDEGEKITANPAGSTSEERLSTNYTNISKNYTAPY